MVDGTQRKYVRMKTIKQLFIPFFLCCVTIVSAQESLFEQIEKNNTVLATLRKQAEAEKIANKTGIYPENPEIEYHYLWGSPDAPGNRTDFSAVQRFDFPTSYYYKKKVADMQNKQVDLKYLLERKDVLLEAKNLSIRLIYQNALSEECASRFRNAQKTVDSYQSRLDKGDASVLDLNKAKVDLLKVKKAYEATLVEKDFLAAELTRLNGGIPIDRPVSGYSDVLLPASFEVWYESQKEKNRDLQYWEREAGLSREAAKLQRSMNLPKISAGYMSEKVLTERFQGITVGLSIPLWENKNTVRQAKARTLALREAENDAQIRFRNQMEALYRKASHLKEILADYRQNALSDRTPDLLKKALEAGEIPLIDYLMEMTIYYEIVNNRLETERDFHLTAAELMQWDM
jgi:outer membrane protein TolC